MKKLLFLLAWFCFFAPCMTFAAEAQAVEKQQLPDEDVVARIKALTEKLEKLQCSKDSTQKIIQSKEEAYLLLWQAVHSEGIGFQEVAFACRNADFIFLTTLDELSDRSQSGKESQKKIGDLLLREFDEFLPLLGVGENLEIKDAKKKRYIAESIVGASTRVLDCPFYGENDRLREKVNALEKIWGKDLFDPEKPMNRWVEILYNRYCVAYLQNMITQYDYCLGKEKQLELEKSMLIRLQNPKLRKRVRDAILNKICTDMRSITPLAERPAHYEKFLTFWKKELGETWVKNGPFLSNQYFIELERGNQKQAWVCARLLAKLEMETQKKEGTWPQNSREFPWITYYLCMPMGEFEYKTENLKRNNERVKERRQEVQKIISAN